jgi:nucleotide-binding universal stress UspA family protein
VSPSPGTIVCGIDHSPGARTAAAIASDLSRRLGAHLVMVYAVPLPRASRELGVAEPASFVTIDQMQQAGVTLLEEVVKELGGGPEITREVRIGGAAEVIGATAEDSQADLAVVGSRGLGFLGSVLLGSVSRSLAARGPCPTLIVPESASPVGDGPVVCAVDDSDGARAAVRTAAEVSERLATRLLLVTVTAVDDPSTSADEHPIDDAGLGTGPEWVYMRGEPAGAIIDAADAHRAGMIVIGSRGRGALAASMLGSVSSAVAGRSTRPVMVVRAAA